MTLPRGIRVHVELPTAGTAGSQVIDDHFRNYPNLQIPHSVLKRIPQLLKSFNKKWHPAEKRKCYLQVFSRSSWVSVDEKEKNNHGVRGCHTCKTKYQSLISAFPGSRTDTEPSASSSITFSSEELSSPRKLGRKVLAELSPICQAQFSLSPQEVLQKTPKSRLVRTPTITEDQNKKRKIVREARKVLQDEMDKTAATTVMGNRISWSKFDSIRKQALCDEVTKNDGNTGHTEPSKKHGCKPEALCVDKENLLQEAQSWSPTQNINWSELARRYGLNTT